MGKSKTKIRQILCWCKKRKTLLAFLAVMLFLSVSAAVIAYTKTAWPQAGDNSIVIRMDGPWGDSGLEIYATTGWGNKDKTKGNFGEKVRTISLRPVAYNGNKYNARLQQTSRKTYPDSSGKNFLINFDVIYTVPAHYRFKGWETSKTTWVGTYETNAGSVVTHYGSNHDVKVNYTVNVSNFGMVTGSDGARHKCTHSVIRLQRDAVTVQYTNNYGGGWTSIGTKYCGDSLSGLPSSLERPFYRFTGWKDEHGHSHTPNSRVCTGGDWFAWLYAQWEDYYYNINYDSNGSGQATKTQKIDRNESKAELMDDIFARPHYELTGWNTKPDGTGTPYPLGGTVNHLTTTNKGTVTLYAQWRLLTHTVKFDGNGATSGQMADQFIDEGDPQELRTNAFKRKGYYFCGWSTKRDGAAEYRDEETFTAVPNTGGQTTTLYAVWSRDGSFQVDNVTDDTSMFEGCDNLVGGNGTTYDYSHIDSKEANIDIPSDRGYFTAK